MDLTRTQKGLAALGALAVASVVFGLYDRFFWFDEALHAYNFFALTLLLTVYAYGVVLTGGREHGFILVLTIAAIGLGLGALWKIAEFAYDRLVAPPSVILPKVDTIHRHAPGYRERAGGRALGTVDAARVGGPA